MKRISLSLILCASLFVIGCKNDKKEKEVEEKSETEMTSETKMEKEEKEVKKVKVQLNAVSDSKLSGNVVFTEENGEVTMTAMISGLEEGKHAIHIHEKGDCSAADGSSAGGHWNPTDAKHGKWGSADGYHKGDIGNFEVDANGNGTVNLTTSEWCIGCDDAKKNLVGKAVIVHNGVDDYTSQPSGAAGTRVGCGVIKK
ncbi:superoxide dismutase family protein [Christiangramia salexigens]|uniref:Superoxide dismutase n=1 Tax=Christiangramia salexigens TaxID=1913577 RepID=A0A1L3J3R1_9FLAO|nr:superoxide dismutase family protein [Christiangramia salexigens]APG59767.1 superoxide dismutase [Christiangramia salexigens]